MRKTARGLKRLRSQMAKTVSNYLKKEKKEIVDL